MIETHYSIKAAAKLTGLSPHVIRIWEKRYGAVKPIRTGTNRRVYLHSDVSRLGLLKQATLAGHSIGNIANLPLEQLQLLARELAENQGLTGSRPAPEGEPAIEQCLQAIRDLNTQALEDALSRAVVRTGQHGVLEKVIGPLATTIGDLWREGSLLAAHEHFASAVIRNFLARNSKPFAFNTSMPTIVVATPSGQLHELGAVMVAAAANDLGWRVVYIGTSLPAAEIAATALQNRARAVALSVVYPCDDPNLPGELQSLKRYLPPETQLIVGGRAAEAYNDVLKSIGAIRANKLGELYTALDGLRATVSP